MTDIPPKEARGVRQRCVSEFNQIAKCVENRCWMLGPVPHPEEIPAQIALRSTLRRRGSFKNELASARTVVDWFIENGGWPDGVEPRDWLTRATPEDVAALRERLLRPAGDFIADGKGMLQGLIDRLKAVTHPGSEEDAALQICGISPKRVNGKPRDRENLEPVKEIDLRMIDDHIGEHSHSAPFETLKSPGTGRVDNKALLRTFMRAIWLTGMRPVEVFGCRVFVGDPSRECGPDEIREIREEPLRAVQAGILMPFDALHPIRPGGSFTGMTERIRRENGVPPVLLIRNAKTRHANPDLSRPFRTQILDGIDGSDLGILCLASLLRGIEIPERRRNSLTVKMSFHLKKISKVVLPWRSDDLNLYALRHDFATRARRRFHVWEVAALMGHTGRRMPYAYGKRKTRKRSGSGSGGVWMPGCDPGFAAVIRDAWDARRGRSARIEARGERMDAVQIHAPSGPGGSEV